MHPTHHAFLRLLPHALRRKWTGLRAQTHSAPAQRLPMAVLHDPAQAYKTSADPFAEHQAENETDVPTEVHCAPARKPDNEARCPALPQGIRLIGRFSDICAELEKRALQEELFLRAG